MDICSCDLGRRKIRALQIIEAGWITNIPRYADPFDKYSPVWITNIPRYADLFDKYSQVFSDSTGFCGIMSTEENSQSFD